MNPIEDAFTVVKKWLKANEEYARSNPIGAIEAALRSVTPEHAYSFFADAKWVPKK